MMQGTKFRGWLLLLLIGIAFFVISTEDYTPRHSIYNTGLLGASNLREGLQTDMGLNVSRILISPFILKGDTDIKLITIIGSHREYSTAEINAYRDFVDNGGSLIIFEDFGPARSIAEAMGVQFFSGILRETNDEISVHRPSQFFTRDLASQYIFGADFPVYLLASEATGIVDYQGMLSGDTIPILLSFPSVYLDTDKDNRIDQNDKILSTGFPMGLIKFYGEGNLVVISDASIPLNQFWDRKVEINGELYTVPNNYWSLLMISYLASLAETGHVVFDESHQEVVLTSGVSTLNLFIGVWVGLLNSNIAVVYLFAGIVIFGLLLNRRTVRKRLKRLRSKQSLVVKEDPTFISNPTLAERSISEQYILYQVMKDGFIQIANTEIFNLLRDTGRAEEFLVEMEKQYGDLTKSRRRRELLEIHQKLRDYVDEHLVKWL
jgi:hypothetical protein